MSSSSNPGTRGQKPLTTFDIRQKKQRGEKLVMVTAYDATMARIFDDAGVDMLLVGDSAGMVVQGHRNTLPVTLDQMVYHTACVSRGARRAHIVGDMPFMSYQVSPAQAVESAGRLVQEGFAHAVKLEGGAAVAATAAQIVAAGIPVMGHLGLTPQSVHQLGGFRIQGRDASAARRLLDDAQHLQDAGCYALVLEGIPGELAAAITAALDIPTIGIGAGADCDGQVLVSYDLLGMNPDFRPKFVKSYDDLYSRINAAVTTFADEVRRGVFPDASHTPSASAPTANAAPPPAASSARDEGRPTLRIVHSSDVLLPPEGPEQDDDAEGETPLYSTH